MTDDERRYSTREKLLGLAHHLRTLPPAEASEEARGLIEVVQLAEGLGIDVWGALIPPTEAEADLMVDQLLALFHELRGDDLPPFDLERHRRELAAGSE